MFALSLCINYEIAMRKKNCCMYWNSKLCCKCILLSNPCFKKKQKRKKKDKKKESHNPCRRLGELGMARLGHGG